jgi:hypothetical protein
LQRSGRAGAATLKPLASGQLTHSRALGATNRAAPLLLGPLHALVARGVLRERPGGPRQARASVREALLGSWLAIEAPHTLGRFA